MDLVKNSTEYLRYVGLNRVKLPELDRLARSHAVDQLPINFGAKLLESGPPVKAHFLSNAMPHRYTSLRCNVLTKGVWLTRKRNGAP